MSNKDFLKMVRANEEAEVFCCLMWSWNIDKAIELTKDMEPVDTPLSILADANAMISINECHALTVDLKIPILAIPFSYTKDDGVAFTRMVIDGHHRIHRALLEVVPSLPVITLTEEQERMVRITGPYPTKPKRPRKNGRSNKDHR